MVVSAENSQTIETTDLLDVLSTALTFFVTGFSRQDLSQPDTSYVTGFVPSRCLTVKERAPALQSSCASEGATGTRMLGLGVSANNARATARTSLGLVQRQEALDQLFLASARIDGRLVK